MPPRTVVPAFILVCLLVLALWPPPAGAGTYDVYSCRLPDGTPAPTGGWTSFMNFDPGGEYMSGVYDRCPQGQGLSATLPWQPQSPANAGWRFSAPADTVLTGFLLHRWASGALRGSGVAGYMSGVDGWPPSSPGSGVGEACLSAPPEQTEWCVQVGNPSAQDDPSNEYARSGLQATSLTLGEACSTPDACLGNPVLPLALTIRDARMTLNDVFAPRFDQDPSPQAATNAVELAVSDRGSGVATLEVIVDDNVLAREDQLTAACQKPYVDPVPCPLQRNVAMHIDPKSLLDGDHQVRGRATDAGGNTTLSRPVTITTRDGAIVAPPVEPVEPPADAPFPAVPATPSTAALGSPIRPIVRLKTWFVGKSRRAQRTLRHGQAAELTGRLTTADGKPVADAQLGVQERELGVASQLRPAGAVRTSRDGAFTYRVNPGPTRTIVVSYRALPDDPAPSVIAQATVYVRAGVTLRTAPARVRNGTRMTFSGRVLAEGTSRRALVTIYSLSSGSRSRIPVETVRADSAGRFVYRYRFSYLDAPTTFRFIAVVPKQIGFPYLEGTSRVATVHGRP